ncbi:hypothetical protein [Pedobacter rhizosphaerae]|uniref:Fibronectin type-III domain-containing protein n=1 Tax=Pedobacter rhizosphaerae TaxID=390241 RepID=A0A1H9U3T6_9SPHI|nr:hypothetical protein [Pedobacter rhizosphaerae]SES04165.1 hypothetical protein SAMN04488023_12729 [Pedobacter rhizosphaerae]
MKRIFSIALALSTLFSCKRTQVEIPPPTAATLIVPARNEACSTGLILTPSQSSVSFSWSATDNTGAYEVNVKNLLTGKVISKKTESTSTSFALDVNTPYSWFVVSYAVSDSRKISSETWKFYNSGPGISSYAPFPAEVVFPIIGQDVGFGQGQVRLEWKGMDVDQDIAGYDVYFGTSNNPGLLSGNLQSMLLENVKISANTTYYWKVVTKDKRGNTSDSGIFQFKVR